MVAMSRPPEDERLFPRLKLPHKSGHSMTWEGATHIKCGEMAWARAEGWGMLLDPTHTRAYRALARPGKGPDQIFSKLSYKRTVVVFSLVTETALFGFAVYRGGQCVRRWLVGDGELYYDEGEPLAEEFGAFELEPEEIDETDILEFVRRLFPLRTFEIGLFQMLE